MVHRLPGADGRAATVRHPRARRRSCALGHCPCRHTRPRRGRHCDTDWDVSPGPRSGCAAISVASRFRAHTALLTVTSATRSAGGATGARMLCRPCWPPTGASPTPARCARWESCSFSPSFPTHHGRCPPSGCGSVAPSWVVLPERETPEVRLGGTFRAAIRTRGSVARTFARLKVFSISRDSSLTGSTRRLEAAAFSCADSRLFLHSLAFQFIEGRTILPFPLNPSIG